MNIFSFPRQERLKSGKSISLLFSQGEVLDFSPIKALWELFPERKDSTVKVAFSVSKKRFHRAIDRNLLKRRMRESYRRNSQLIDKSAVPRNQTLHIMFIYTKAGILPYGVLEGSVIKVLFRINEKLRKINS